MSSASLPVEYWSLVQRYLSDLPPHQRQAKLQELLQRSQALPGKRLSAPAGRATTLVVDFDTDQITTADLLINLVLAQEDLCRYRSQAFSLWLKQLVGTEAEQIAFELPTMESLSRLLALLGVPEVNRLQMELSCRLSENCAQAAWVFIAQSQRIAWSLLQNAGPWQGDPRCRLIIDWRRKLQGCGPDISVPEITWARKSFGEVLTKYRRQLPGNNFCRLQILVEGPTEAVLLPYFCRMLGLDFNAQAVAVVPCGGSKQVVRRYEALKELVDMPFLVVLDGDAAKQAEFLQKMLRETDRLLLLESGEIEDLFDFETFLNYVNIYLSAQRLANPVTPEECDSSMKRTQLLDKLWRKRGMGNFDKVGLAHVIIEQPLPPHKVPKEMHRLLELLQELLES